MAENANATDQLVTLSGLNTVWSATKGLYNYLDKRLDNIASFYQYKGIKATWNELLSTSANKGEAYSVTKDYPEDSRDPESYPAWSTGMPPRVYICTENTTGGDASKWAPVGFNVPMASEDAQGIIIQNDSYAAAAGKYGFVKRNSEFEATDSAYGFIMTGYSESPSSTENARAVKLDNGQAYVNIPTGGDGSNGNLGLLKTGDGIKNTSGTISVSVLPTGTASNGILVTRNTTDESFTVENKGVISLYHGSQSLTGGASIKIDSGDGTGDSAGKIKFSKNSQSFQVQVSGWNAGKWDSDEPSSTAVRHTANAAVGSSSKPVYVETNGAATEISTISLSGNGNVASFTDNNSSGSAVTITGKNIDSSVAQSALANTSAALKVTGGIVCTSGIAASKVYHSVWNDISDAIEVQDTLKTSPGYCYFFDGKEYHRTDKYCQKGIIGIHSDTAGSVLGRKGKHKELDISVGGFVLAYVDKEYAPGTPLTSASNGRLTKMSLISRILHPERLVATYWKKETNKEWGDESHKVEVNGRHWVKVR